MREEGREEGREKVIRIKVIKRRKEKDKEDILQEQRNEEDAKKGKEDDVK